MKSIDRIFDLLEFYREEYRWKQDAFACRQGDSWKWYSSEDYLDTVNCLSYGLLSLGIRPGTKVATIMVNSPEWNFFDMAIMQIGAIQVPIYPTISEENYRYIFKDADIEYIIISNYEIYCRIRNVLPELPLIKGLYSIRKVRGVRNWKEILALGRSFCDTGELEIRKAAIRAEDLATIIYTSGTTGRPKGVMLNHRNFISNFLASAEIPGFTPHHRALSFLPLCHVYERMLNYLYQYFGMSVYYSESLDQVADHIREVRPHVFAAVPRVLEKIYNKFISRGRNLPGVFRAFFFWAVRQGHKYEFGHEKGLFFDLKLLVANIFIFSLWRRRLGGHIQLIVSGSASLHPRLTRIFWAAHMPVLEGYGLTETSPVIAVFNLKKGGAKFGTVGTVLNGVTLKIADDGEILCKGPNVMMGYYNRPEKTKEVIDDEGWFHTGDIGIMEDGRYLRITDRKKEMFKTSTGKNIAPQVIEQRLKESPFIEYIMVMGENRKYTAALIVPDFEHIRKWCEIKKVPFHSREKAVKTSTIIRRIHKEVTRFNLDLGQTEKIKKFRLIADEWSVETGELSPTLKLRRKFIHEKYFQLIEETYRSPEYNYREDKDQ